MCHRCHALGSRPPRGPIDWEVAILLATFGIAVGSVVVALVRLWSL